MIARQLKSWMPRSLYWRATLIIVVPVATLLVVGSWFFIQNLYDTVTRQMTAGVAGEVRLILARVEEAEDPASALQAALEIAAPLGFEINADNGDLDETREYFDWSGVVVVDTLREELIELRAVDLVSRDRFVRVGVDTKHGPIVLDVSRRRVSARNPHQFLVLIGLTAIAMTVMAIAVSPISTKN